MTIDELRREALGLDVEGHLADALSSRPGRQQRASRPPGAGPSSAAGSVSVV
jgi:hypothetical protein